MVHVAVDVGSMYGPRTGVGTAVAHSVAALERRHELRLTRYVLSTRARLTPPDRRLPLPATVAHRIWRHASVPEVDRWLGDPEVVHGTNYVVPPARCARVVSVYDCWFIENRAETDGALRRTADVLRRSVADGATVVASSEATATRVRASLGTDRVRTIHLGPPDDLDDLGEPLGTGPRSLPPAVVDGRFFVAVGTMEKRKNYPRLVRAFGRVAEDIEDVRLVIAGAPGDDTASTRLEVDRLPPKTRARVDLLGSVDPATKSWLMQHAVALAYPSLDEGFGFPILEAQRAGLPVVASSAGSIPEIAGPHALFSPPDDIDALAAHLHWIATSPDLVERLATRGRENLTRFSWEKTAVELSRLYRELVGRG